MTNAQRAQLDRQLKVRIAKIDARQPVPKSFHLTVLSEKFGVSTATIQARIRELRQQSGGHS